MRAEAYVSIAVLVILAVIIVWFMPKNLRSCAAVLVVLVILITLVAIVAII